MRALGVAIEVILLKGALVVRKRDHAVVEANVLGDPLERTPTHVLISLIDSPLAHRPCYTRTNPKVVRWFSSSRLKVQYN